MTSNRYFNHIKQSNGARVYENPLANTKFKIPENPIEIFMKEIPREYNEDDILPHFERFGPIYQFRLLIDYDNNNRGFGYLIYFWDKSALECLDLMGYFIIKPGVMLEVERSQERSHLLAVNVPLLMDDEIIKKEFHTIYSALTQCFICRKTKKVDKDTRDENGTVILKFPDHSAALTAKRFGGQGSVTMWGRNIKILWAKPEEVRQLLMVEDGVQHIVLSGMPDEVDPDEVGDLLCEHISPQEIIQIRQMTSNWFLEFTNSRASQTAFNVFRGRAIGVGFISQERLRALDSFVDFDFELRCMCLANYWDPPIFVYSRVIPCTRTQFCAVIIKNNRRNLFCTFFLELVCHDLVELHSRVCETLLLIITDLKDLPKRNTVIKCTENSAFIVGAIHNMESPFLTPSLLATRESIFLYTEEIFALSRMCFKLIAFHDINEIHQEYKMILREKNPRHQIICGIESDGNLLGCINPIYREGKALKYQLNSRHMILAMCDARTHSNVQFRSFPEIKNVKHFSLKPYIRFKTERFELIPLTHTQRQNVLPAFRPCIEFSFVDTYSPLYRQLAMLQAAQYFRQGFHLPTGSGQVQAASESSAFCLKGLLKSLPK